VTKLLEIHADRAWRRFDKMVERQMKPVESLFRGYLRAELQAVLPVVRDLSIARVAAAQDDPAMFLVAIGIKATEKRLQTALEGNGKRWSKRIEGVLGKAAVPFAVDTAYALSFKFPGFPKATQLFIRNYVPKIVDQLAESTRHRIMKTVSRGIEGGLTLPEIESDIRQVYKSWDRSRPEVIARTETGRVASVTQNDVIAEAGLDVLQIWLTARDDRVRDSHEELEGEEREIGEEFSPGLKFPRDPDGPPEETIQCRCSRLLRLNKK